MADGIQNCYELSSVSIEISQAALAMRLLMLIESWGILVGLYVLGT
jgi:hypothetical protein